MNFFCRKKIEFILALPACTISRNLVVFDGVYFAGNLFVQGFLNIWAKALGSIENFIT